MKFVFQIGLEDNFTDVTVVMNRSDAPPFVKFEDQFTNATSLSQCNLVLPIVKFVLHLDPEY